MTCTGASMLLVGLMVDAIVFAKHEDVKPRHSPREI
jgi:hypothetical protein